MWYEFDTCKYWIDYLYSEYKHDIGSIANIYTCVTEEGCLFSENFNDVLIWKPISELHHLLRFSLENVTVTQNALNDCWMLVDGAHV